MVRWVEVYKTKIFYKWMRTNKITDTLLKQAIVEIINGLIDVTLGDGLYKKRIKIGGKGKRGGSRVILAYKKNKRLIFLYGFNKNEKDNISFREKQTFKKLSDFYLSLTSLEISSALAIQELAEIKL